MLRESRQRGIAVAAAGVLASLGACKNSLTFQPGSGLGAGCSEPGNVCSVGQAGVGDGGQAAGSTILGPSSLAFDSAGNLFVAENLGNRIRRIDTKGTITTFAGTGQDSLGITPGVGGPLTPVPNPVSVTITPDGIVFWTEDSTCTIYSLNPTSGVVAFAAGNGNCGNYSPDASYGPFEISFAFGDCSHIRSDSLGNLIISDSGNNRIYYFNRGASPATVWGTTVAAGQVTAIVGSGNTYPGAAGDGGPATSANFYGPCDAVPMPDGSLAVVDTNDQKVRRVDGTTGVVTTLVGTGNQGGGGDNGPGVDAELDYPGAAAAWGPSGLLISDNTYRLRLLNTGTTSIQFGTLVVPTSFIVSAAGEGGQYGFVTGVGAQSTNMVFSRDNPVAPLTDANLDVLVADHGTDVIWKIDHTTGATSIFAGLGPGGSVASFLDRPSGVAVLSDGAVFAAANNAFVWRAPTLATGTNTVIAGNGSPVASGDGEPATAAGVWGTGLAADAEGALYIADELNGRIRRLDPSGVIDTVAGGGNGPDGGPAISAQLNGPLGVALDSAGNLYIMSADQTIRAVNRGQSATTIAGISIPPGDIATIGGGTGCQFNGDGLPGTQSSICPQDDAMHFATGIVVSGEILYFADYDNDRIRSIDLVSGIMDTVVGSGDSSPQGVGNPTGVTVSGGYLYWTQIQGSYLRRMKLPHGPMEDVAGDGFPGLFGDAGPGTDAELMNPGAVTAGADGILYVADGSHRIRAVLPP